MFLMRSDRPCLLKEVCLKNKTILCSKKHRKQLKHGKVSISLNKLGTAEMGAIVLEHLPPFS